MFKKIIAVFIIVICLVAGLSSCEIYSNPSNDSSREVSRAQIKNEPINGARNAYCGYVVQSGDTVYFLRSDDKIYKIKKGEKKQTKVSDYPVYCFGVYGDYIYYRSYPSPSDSAIEEDGIYRIKTDGTGKVNIVKGDIRYNFFIVDNWIYFTDKGGLFKYNLLNSEKILLTENGYEMSYYNDRIYGYEYHKLDTEIYDYKCVIFSIKTDGTDKKDIVETENARSINVVDDWIYYLDHIGTYEYNYIYKIKIDGTNKTKIEGTEDTQELNVKGDWIYYNDVGRSLYKIKTDGTNKVKLTDEGGDEICVTEQWIYYTEQYIDNKGFNYKNFRIKTDGTEKTKTT